MYTVRIDAAFDWWNVASLSGMVILSLVALLIQSNLRQEKLKVRCSAMQSVRGMVSLSVDTSHMMSRIAMGLW